MRGFIIYFSLMEHFFPWSDINILCINLSGDFHEKKSYPDLGDSFGNCLQLLLYHDL